MPTIVLLPIQGDIIADTFGVQLQNEEKKIGENALLKAVANQPISVAIDATDRTSNSTQAAFLLVSVELSWTPRLLQLGIGTSKDGTKYWLVKNSKNKERIKQVLATTMHNNSSENKTSEQMILEAVNLLPINV
ncbi:hypothetical protein LguiA_035096 [Lonicera macranthoides]